MYDPWTTEIWLDHRVFYGPQTAEVLFMSFYNFYCL